MKHSFQDLYNNLNPEQKKAVNAIDGPVMVVAGPGTGKTHLLTMRVARILQETDTQAENILALTFTETASLEMQRRLVSLVGSEGLGCYIRTFHGFCNDIIQENPEEFPHTMDAVPVSDVERVRIVRAILTEGSFAVLRPFAVPFYYVSDMLRTIDALKKEGITPSSFSLMVQKQEKSLRSAPDLEHAAGKLAGRVKGRYEKMFRAVEKNKELALVYASYQEQLKNRQLYDYNDMILFVLEALQGNQDLLLTLRERFLYLMADEHQDANHSQNMVLELLCGDDPSPNLFIVGDEKQAIFRFQGASLENFLYFKEKYPTALLVELKENYRSGSSIVRGAHSIIPSALTSSNKGMQSRITVQECATQDAELLFAAQKAKASLKEGKEVALLYRTNRDALPISRLLRQEGVPFAMESDESVLGDEDIAMFLSLLRAVCHAGDQEALVQSLHAKAFGLHPLLLYRLVSSAASSRVRVLEAMEQHPEFREAAFKIASWMRMAKTQRASGVLETILRESGFLEDLLSRSEAFEKIQKFRRLFKEAHSFRLLEEFLEYIALAQEYGVPLKTKLTGIGREGVRLMTAHKSKGKEFDVVLLMGATRNAWEGRRARRQFILPEQTRIGGAASTEEEERKLFYVALTRAREEVVISFSLEGEEGRQLLPSKFVQEMQGATKEETVAEDPGKLDVFLRPSAYTGPTLKEASFVSTLFDERGLSVTALNNYLDCPWKFFYVNLVRLPKAPDLSQVYGILAHAALRDLFANLKRGEKKDEPLLSYYTRHLERYNLPPQEKDRLQERGAKAFAAYPGAQNTDPNNILFLEFSVKGAVLRDSVRLTGKIDRIEEQDNGLLVVDYKTGKPRSRNDIEGKTKSSTGAYKRQLVFYKLLLETYNPKYHVQEGALEFVEPTPRGEYKTESFVIGKEETQELEELILKVTQEIRDLAFWNRTCAKKDCQFCSIAKYLRS